MLVVAGIGVAIVASLATLYAAGGAAMAALAADALAVAYAVQGTVEARHPAWRKRPALLVEERAPSMALAVVALAACGGGARLVTWGALLAAASLLVLRPREGRPRVPIGATKGCFDVTSNSDVFERSHRSQEKRIHPSRDLEER